MNLARYDKDAALRFETKVWRFIAFCFLGSSLAFMAAIILIGGFRG